MYDLNGMIQQMEAWCARNAAGFGTKRHARAAWAKPRLASANTNITALESSLKEEGISKDEVRRRIRDLRSAKAVRDHLIGLVVAAS
jgi:hypothetical protein